MKAWRIENNDGIDALALVDLPSPQPARGQVKVRIMASSINARDFNTVRAPGARNTPLPRIPNSDGAGEVVAVGEGVTHFRPGDRIASCFFARWPAGDVTEDVMASALGGPLDGVLAEEAVLEEAGVVHIPDHLSYAEAATLPCAAVTAWNALVERGGLRAGHTVLLMGTGGVSVFGLQIATMFGARAIVTSKSDAKLERARRMGAWETINYAATPDWHTAVREITGGRGVDHVVEVGGPGTLQKSIEAACMGGNIGMIGVLTQGEINPLPMMRKSLRLNGIYVGSREMFERMNAAISANALRPVIDRTFSFAEAREAYKYMAGAEHFGKIVIELGG
ncbi:MAG: NAD(P)-dependent alcohol dehydrogenase [Rhodospirillaceae bacterium]